MSDRRASMASQRSEALSDRTSVLSPAKTGSVAEQQAQPTRQYANSITSSQMTHETMDYTNDDQSTHTAQAEQVKANLKTEKLPVHPKIVPTNADLKRSNMLDRYAGIRDPTFKATWDLSEIAKAGDKSGKAGSIFSFSTAKTKKTYDVAVKNPIIAAKEAEDRSGAHGGGGGGGLGGLFRRSSRASRNHPQEGSPNKSNTLIDETRDPKELLAEAEHQAAWEAQEKERKEAEQAEERERQRISQEMAKQERKRKDAEAKEQRRSEKEQEKERKRQSKAATVNTVNNGPPPRYSQAGAAGAPAAASQEGDGAQTTASDEPQHSEGHRLGDEVPAGEERPHESNFNEEFSVLDHPAMAARQAKDGDATSTSSNGSSITEEAPRGAQDSDAGVAAAATESASPDGKTFRDIGTQTLVDSSAQTDPQSGTNTPVAVGGSSGTRTPQPQASDAAADKVAFNEPPRASALPSSRTAPPSGTPASTAGTAASPANRNHSGSSSGGLKGLFRRLSRTKSYKGKGTSAGTGNRSSETRDAAQAAASEAPREQPGKATVTTQAKPEHPDDAKSMLTLDSMWVKPAKKPKAAAPAAAGTAQPGSSGVAALAPAMHLYHEKGVHDTVYPSAPATTAEEPKMAAPTTSSTTQPTSDASRGPSSAFALYHAGGHHGTVYPHADGASPGETTAQGTAPAVSEIQQTQHFPNSFHPEPVPFKPYMRNGLGPVAKDQGQGFDAEDTTPAAAAAAAPVTALTTEATPGSEPVPVAEDAAAAHAVDEAEGSSAAVAERPDDVAAGAAGAGAGAGAAATPTSGETAEANEPSVADQGDEHVGDTSVGSAFHLYHESGHHDTVYPELK